MPNATVIDKIIAIRLLLIVYSPVMYLKTTSSPNELQLSLKFDFRCFDRSGYDQVYHTLVFLSSQITSVYFSKKYIFPLYTENNFFQPKIAFFILFSTSGRKLYVFTLLLRDMVDIKQKNDDIILRKGNKSHGRKESKEA